MKKNILVKLFLELIMEERRGPVQATGRVCSTFDLLLIGTADYINKDPSCIRRAMDQLNEIGLSDEIICTNCKDFVEQFEREKQEDVPEWLWIQYILINQIIDMANKEALEKKE